MTNFISGILPYATLVSHVVLVALVLALWARKSWGKDIFLFLGRYAVILGFLMALAAVVGSLFYSEVVGFPPCTLCWWTRIFLYPLVVIFGIALFKGKRAGEPFLYALPLILGAFLVSLYFSYYSLGGASLLPCTSGEGSCSQIFVKEFGYITIPMMSLTLSAYLLLLTWINKLYRNDQDSDTR